MHDREMVLDTWWTGASRKETAELTGVPIKRVNALIVSARNAGDPRAQKRYVKGRKDGRSHDSRGIYRSRADVQAIRQFVLDNWAAGLTAKEIGKLLHLDDGYAYSFVERARATGDPRAAHRLISALGDVISPRKHVETKGVSACTSSPTHLPQSPSASWR